MTEKPRHSDPAIAAFLADGEYDSIEEWMEDSDFTQQPDGSWVEDHNGTTQEPEDAIAIAMEACGFLEGYGD